VHGLPQKGEYLVSPRMVTMTAFPQQERRDDWNYWGGPRLLLLRHRPVRLRSTQPYSSPIIESGLSAHYNLPMNLDEWTDDDIRQWLLLRAIEWTNWPAFLSQLLASLFLVAAWWPVVIVGVLEIIRK